MKHARMVLALVWLGSATAQPPASAQARQQAVSMAPDWVGYWQGTQDDGVCARHVLQVSADRWQYLCTMAQPASEQPGSDKPTQQTKTMLYRWAVAAPATQDPHCSIHYALTRQPDGQSAITTVAKEDLIALARKHEAQLLSYLAKSMDNTETKKQLIAQSSQVATAVLEQLGQLKPHRMRVIKSQCQQLQDQRMFVLNAGRLVELQEPDGPGLLSVNVYERTGQVQTEPKR